MSLVDELTSKYMEKLVKEFNFEQVETIMRLVNWTYGTLGKTYFPNKAQLIEIVKRLVCECYSYYYSKHFVQKIYDPIVVSTGGFEVSLHNVEEEFNISVKFILCEFQTPAFVN